MNTPTNRGCPMVETEPETPKAAASAGSSRAHAAKASTEGLSQRGAASGGEHWGCGAKGTQDSLSSVLFPSFH